MMELTRRDFVATAVVATGFLKLGATAAFGQKGHSGPGLFPLPELSDRLSKLDWDAFLPYQYSDFTFTKGSESYNLRLAKMVDSAPGGFMGKGEHPCFELHFEANFITPLPDGTYTVEHFALGTFELFITPGGRKGRTSSAIAIINRLVK